MRVQNTIDGDEAKTEIWKLHEVDSILYGVTDADHQSRAKPVETVDME